MKLVYDLDDTLLYTKKIENKIAGRYETIGENTELIEDLRNRYNNDDTIIIHTARHWDLLEETKKLLKNYGIPYTTLIMAKPTADYYIDDKGIKPEQFLKEQNNE